MAAQVVLQRASRLVLTQQQQYAQALLLQLRLHPQDIMAPPMIAPPMLISEEESSAYGIRIMQVLATNNPSCLHDYVTSGSTFPVPKQTFTVGSLDFAEAYESNMVDSIVGKIKDSLSNNRCEWVLNVFRMGFGMEQMANPIVVHLLLLRNGSLDFDTYSLVGEIGAIVAANWKGEAVHVDVCQMRYDLRNDSRFKDVGVDLSARFAPLYTLDHPLPGFSVGPKDLPNVAGSFTGFIKHLNTTFGLTCEHVVNGKDATLLGPDAYKYQGGEKFNITMPALKDHEKTKMQIKEKPFDDIRIPEMLKDGMKKYWEEVKKPADDFNTEVGHVYATSGRDKSGTRYQGSLDWAIFTCRFPNAQNKHLLENEVDSGSGFQLNDDDAREFVRKQLGADFIPTARDHFKIGPNFKPLLISTPQQDEIFFKFASRSSDLKEALYNGIKATKNGDGRGVTREDCYITYHSRTPGYVVSAPGDSGALILDINFRPTAMIWGGDAFEGTDVTYATPLYEILRDIERRCGWDSGSVAFC